MKDAKLSPLNRCEFFRSEFGSDLFAERGSALRSFFVRYSALIPDLMIAPPNLKLQRFTANVVGLAPRAECGGHFVQRHLARSAQKTGFSAWPHVADLVKEVVEFLGFDLDVCRRFSDARHNAGILT